MLTLNVQVGSNPLTIHNPLIYLPTTPSITIGDTGEIVSWKYVDNKPIPLYLMIPSVSGDAGKLTCVSCLMLRLLSQYYNIRYRQMVSHKIVTIHEDNRLRIWELEDGTCISITPNNILHFKVQSIASFTHASRFIILLGDKYIGVIDCWTMKLVCYFESQIDSFSKIVKGIVNENLDLEILDSNGKMYRMPMAELFAQKFLDIGTYISNAIKSLQQLDKTLSNIKSTKILNSFKKLQQTNYAEQLKSINSYLDSYRKTETLISIFNPKVLEKYPQLEAELRNEEASVSNIYFMKGKKLWYWVGMKSGKLYGIPAVIEIDKEWGIMRSNQYDRAVKYISIIDNIMIVSWDNGFICVYTVDNHEYIIEQQLKDNNKQQPTKRYIDLQKANFYKCKLSAPIKYALKNYNTTIRSNNMNDLLGFQLYNNEVVLFDVRNKKMQNFRGISFDEKIYCILFVEDYIGIASSSGIHMHNSQKYQRTISYSQWAWEDYEIFDKIVWEDDYHSYDIKNVTGMSMIEFSNRFYFKKIDYSNSTQLLYETYDRIEEDQLTNEAYPRFQFLQKMQTLSTIHSKSEQNNTTILKLKHNNVKKDNWNNTSYIIHANLNRQLDTLDGELTQILTNDYILYSLFIWEQMKCQQLRQLIQQIPKKVLLRKRYIHQGIGKTFTIYFDNETRFHLSKQLCTYQAIATTSFFQLYSNKNISFTDRMVEIVEYFTSIKQLDTKSRGLNAQSLSKMSICQNPNITKACFNLLMSTVITQNVAIHPTYEYFLISMKNMEENKSKLSTLNITESHWMVLMGIYFIYGTNQQNKEQYQFCRVIVQRIIESIQLLNFERKPQLVSLVMKIFNEGINKWKQFISKDQIIKFITELFRMFFYYDGLSYVPSDDKKFNFCFNKLSNSNLKKMKQTILRTVVYISKEFNQEFLQVLRIQSVNQKFHLAYPASVIEILRQYIKSQKPFTHLVFFVQLLLQCLSPMTPQLRKYVQKNVLATLQLMCLYKTISFNQPSQKLSLLTHSHIYIYCLRTSTKWRTINIKNTEEKQQRNINPDNSPTKFKNEKDKQNMVLEMSPKGTYVALLANSKLQIWRLSSGFWSGVLGAFSQGWSFEAEGNTLVWQQDQQSITVLNANPSKNKNYVL